MRSYTASSIRLSKDKKEIIFTAFAPQGKHLRAIEVGVDVDTFIKLGQVISGALRTPVPESDKNLTEEEQRGNKIELMLYELQRDHGGLKGLCKEIKEQTTLKGVAK